MLSVSGRQPLFKTIRGRLYMGLFTAGAAARFCKTIPLFKNKSARKAPAGYFHQFFPKIADRSRNMFQMAHDLLFRDAQRL